MMEKRLYPRISTQLSAVVENSEGLHLNVTALDTSSEGFCIQCNTVVRNMLTPGGNFVRDGKPVELFVWLELPATTGKVKKIGARCHVAFSRRISSDQCKIGMRYMELDKGGYDTLVKYIESALVSNDQHPQPNAVA